MHPILFQWGWFTLYSFGFLVAVAIAVAVVWASRRLAWAAVAEESSLEMATNVMTGLMACALVAARLWYIGYVWPLFLASPLAVLFSGGGLVWYGGVLGALAFLAVWAWRRKVPLLRVTDTMAPITLQGLFWGRLGCLMAGCCYGAPCDLPWAVHYPALHPTHGIGVHPAPLYEALGALILMGLLLAGERFLAWGERRGLMTGAFFASYGVLRFVMEGLRGDRVLVADGLSVSQWVSVVGLLLGVALMVRAGVRCGPAQASSPVAEV